MVINKEYIVFFSKNIFSLPYIYWITLIVINIYFFSGVNYEMLSTKHYIEGAGGYYGGYGNIVVNNNEKYFPLHIEAESNYFNVYKFNEKTDNISYHINHAAAVDRLFIPFLSAIIILLSFGKVTVVDAYFIINLILWISSIVLIYKISLIYFDDYKAAFLSSLLVISYPVFTLMMHSIKGQYFSSVFMLFGIYFYEKYYYKDNPYMNIKLIEKLFILVLFFFIGFYCSGGNLFFLLYLIGRYSTSFGKINSINFIRIKNILVISVSFIISYLLAKYINSHSNPPYGFHFAAENYSLKQIIFDSFKFIKYSLSNADVSNLKFMNYSGYTFFTVMIPKLMKGLFYLNPLIVLIGILSIIFKPETRKYCYIAIILMGGHLGTFITSYIWYYGYMSAGTVLLLLIITGKFISDLGKKNKVLKITSYILFFAILSFFMIEIYPGVRWHMDNYFTIPNEFKSIIKHEIYVYHDNAKTIY